MKFYIKPKCLIINYIVRIINVTRIKIKHIQKCWIYIDVKIMHKCCNMNENQILSIFEFIILLKLCTL